MIKIQDKSRCCGCSACVQVCPQHCIVFNEDKKGFCYPIVDEDLCVNCTLCEKVCPCLNQSMPKEPLKVFAAINPNENVRMTSSSGGIFTMLAEKIIDEGGVVFGARFDEKWEVRHDYTESKEGIIAFRGSKYVQSRIGNTYKEAKEFLEKGRQVLFSGTSCHIAGLKRFLRKDYDNLLTIDVICHGVPSPKVWRMYLDEVQRNGHLGKNTISFSLTQDISGGEVLIGGSQIKNISFRDKRSGWKRYGFSLTTSVSSDDGKQNIVSLSHPANDNPYMKGFIRNFTLRPSCFCCPAKSGKSGSDITLADFWGVEDLFSDFSDDKGTSCIIINREKGFETIDMLDIYKRESKVSDIVSQNPSFQKSSNIPSNYNQFWLTLNSSGAICALNDKTNLPLKKRLRTRVIVLMQRLGLLKVLKQS